MADNFYEVTLTNGTVLGEVFDAVVANANTDDALTSLSLIRRGANSYAQPTSLNFVHILENFANAVAPSNPLTGQLWYDSATKKMKVYDATTVGFLPIDGTGLASGLANAITLSISGDVTGSAQFDGTANTDINVSLQPMSGLQAGTYSLATIEVDSFGRITNAFSSANTIGNSGGVINGNVVVDGANHHLNVANGKVREGGFDLVPVGAIIMWSGNTVPAGWALCDGTTVTSLAGSPVTTPNLSGRFIVGVSPGAGYVVGGTGGFAYQNGVSVSSSGGHTHSVAVNSAGAHNHLGTTGNHTLTVAELPPHTHGLGDVSGFRAIGSGLAYNGAGEGAKLPAITQTNSTGSGVGHSHTIASSGDHTHTANAVISGEHIHTITSFDNRPPYYVLAYIMKL
jgi:hypothetical protein